MSFHLRVHRLVKWLIYMTHKFKLKNFESESKYFDFLWEIFIKIFDSKFSKIDPSRKLQSDSQDIRPASTYFMTHRISKIHLEIQTLGSLKWGWSIIRFWTYRWARISSELFLLVMWLSHKLFCHNLPRDSHGMNKHVATNTHLSKYMFFDDSTNFDKNWNNFSN